jgi:signal transduction histidine kinase/ligand-binding sensor domain-containing protein
MRGRGRYSFRLSCGLIAAGCGLVPAGNLSAQDQKIFQRVHTAWKARDGAPQNINTLAQTADGILWLGTRDGLYGFDGLTFSLFQPVSGSMPRRNVQSLFATRDGDLWAWGRGIRAVRIREGVATAFDRVENAGFQSVGFIQQSSDRTIWAILNQTKLVRLGDDGIWHAVASPDAQQIGSFLIDSSDTQWLVADSLLYRRARSQEAFTSAGIAVYGPAKFEEAQDHTIWIAGYSPMGVKPLLPPGQPPEVGLKHIDQSGKRLANPVTKFDVTDVAAGLDGSLWVSHVDAGLQRLRDWEMKGTAGKDDDSPDAFEVSDGLTTTGYRALLRDRDGNIWSAGGRGLDRFQVATMAPVVPGAINGLWSFCLAPNGDVWLSLFDGYFAVMRQHRLIRLKDQTSTGSLLCSKDGSVLLRGNGGIATVHHDQVEILPLLSGHGNYGDRYHFTSMVVLPDGRLLAATIGATENGLWTYEGKTWKPFLPTSGIARIQALWEDTQDNLYLGSADGRIAVLEPASFNISSSESTGIGAIEGFSDTSYGILAFGENGVALHRGDRFQMLFFASPESASSVTGVAEDRGRNIWINGTRAIARIASGEMSAAASDPSHRIQLHEFREGEFRGSDHPTTLRNSAQIDSQGRVWLATANGVVYIDPEQVVRPLRIPTVKIRSIAADGHLLTDNRTFPPGTQTLNVHYAGIDLSNPAGVIYRYKLVGSDLKWQNVGSRTEAVYTHPRPGTYTFQVMASNGGETWSAPVESAAFTILPAFYQSWWFEALAIAGGGLLVWVGLAARVRYVGREIRMRAEERAAERIRIARELHDTLLQGVQGLLLSFHVAAEKVTDSHESKKALEKALATADRVILDARDRLNRLRSERVTSSEFEPSIEAFAADVGSATNIGFAMESTGNRRPLNPDILEELCYIAREAITNAFRHSSGSHIVFTLDYGRKWFRMECRDDGSGFGEDAPHQAEAKGHWGFRGMSERAEKIGGRFSYESWPDKGTAIRVVLPSRRAYLRVHLVRTLFRFD